MGKQFRGTDVLTGEADFLFVTNHNTNSDTSATFTHTVFS